MKNDEIEVDQEDHDQEFNSVVQELMPKYGLSGLDISEVPSDLLEQLEQEAEGIVGRPRHG